MPKSRDPAVDGLASSLALDDGDRARLADLRVRIADEQPALAEQLHAWLTARSASAAPPAGAARPAVAAISALRGELDDRIFALYPPGEARLVARAVDKLLDRELALVLDHYQLAAEHKLLARERDSQADRALALQTLSAGLAHEVRNPLNSAKLQLELLERRLRRDGDDPKLIAPIEQANCEIERLDRLLAEFLAFARPTDLALGDHDAAAIVREAITAEHSLAQARRAAVALTADEPCSAQVDAGKLAQIARHLVRNAIEAVAPGGCITVTVHGDHLLHLVVADDGPGIPAAVQRRIYEPFFSTKEAGAGLGMAIVHSMVTQHGGTIAVDSSPRGTRFAIALPRRGQG